MSEETVWKRVSWVELYFDLIFVGTRSLVTNRSLRVGPPLRAAVITATVCLALLRPLISTTGVVLATAAWAVALAGYVTWRMPDRLKDVAADPLVYFRSAAS
ncbi:hypothetical protein I6A60_26580 [Frankia sp. AgB1.9]|uniref:hypothetical protein n=1 Tax=unclassified Frankia TaxID=2632575 RepID=UPI001931421B|nr:MULTISPECIES: hypothetical protein [unclassified Frankia]MBL7492731.1 hypothetical protein [Frankia sp. AgW1.1]MBL7551404.1 hypothetical protein [Frankia sp. AgB1.9]MBL7620739.1 hypothetical protein [Frankia sp. AgB1.8]